MKFSLIVNDHSHFNSISYHALLERLQREEITNYVLNSKKAQILLSVIEDSQRISSPAHLDYLRNELLTHIQTDPEFENRFLLLEEISRFFVRHNLLANIGRGSAAASIVFYGLNITKIDPIEYQLDFRRFSFLNIDLDVPNRELLIKHLITRYPNQIALLATESLFKVKTAILEVMRKKCTEKEKFELVAEITRIENQFTDPADDFSLLLEQIINHPLAKSIRDSSGIKELKTLSSNLTTPSLDEKQKWEYMLKNSELIKNFFQNRPLETNQISKLIGTHQHFNVHAGAIVFLDNLADYKKVTPKSSNTFNLPVLHPMYYEELYGKQIINILGHSVLEKINQAGAEMGPIKEKDPTWDKLNQAIKNSKEVKLFNIDTKSPALKKFDNFSSIEELALFIALSRTSSRFINYPEENPSCPKRFKEILKETKGWLIWQEDVFKIIDRLSLKVEPALALKNLLKNRDIPLEGLSEEEEKWLREQVRYSFNKSHAIAYAHYPYLQAKYL